MNDNNPDSKVRGATWGPSGTDRTQVGTMLAPRTLLSGKMCPMFFCDVFCSARQLVQWWWLNGDRWYLRSWPSMMTSSNWNIFRVTGPLCGEFTGHRWIPLTKASDAELWGFLWSAPEKQLSKKWRHRWFEMPSRSLWRQCDALIQVMSWRRTRASDDLLSIEL